MSGHRYAYKILKEPPLRLLAKWVLGLLPSKASTRMLWDISPRPSYLAGVWLAAQQARAEGLDEICAIEFGVAGGNGLVCLQREAAAVEQETGVKIQVFGFDHGDGLPEFLGDHRDHPDAWSPGDYPMDVARLRERLDPRTTLVLGNVKKTVPEFVSEGSAPPVGFISMDVDLYSSTTQALKILTLPNAKRLRRTFIYFDDVELTFNHRFAGELLAIDEFNVSNQTLKIDRLRGFNIDRPFPEKAYLRMMYVAHDLKAIAEPASSRRGHSTMSLNLQ